MTSLLILSSLVYPVTLLRKRISAASRRVMSLFVVNYVEPKSKNKFEILVHLVDFIIKKEYTLFKYIKMIIKHLKLNGRVSLIRT